MCTMYSFLFQNNKSIARHHAVVQRRALESNPARARHGVRAERRLEHAECMALAVEHDLVRRRVVAGGRRITTGPARECDVVEVVARVLEDGAADRLKAVDVRRAHRVLIFDPRHTRP